MGIFAAFIIFYVKLIISVLDCCMDKTGNVRMSRWEIMLYFLRLKNVKKKKKRILLKFLSPNSVKM